MVVPEIPKTAPKKRKSSSKKRGNKTIVEPFTPKVVFSEEPIILGDNDLKWTERFGGVFCFYEGRLGISFKDVPDNYIWEVDRQFITDERGQKKFRCCIPVLPGTFQPLDAPQEQIQIMATLLEIADVIEALMEAETNDDNDIRCDELRIKLNSLYNEFVSEHGLLSNCKSYYDNAWNDTRLECYLTELLDSSGNKADIFRKRTRFPPKRIEGQIFFEENIDERLSSAFSWCMGWLGRVDMDEIAEKSGVSPEFALNNLLNQGLVFRNWKGISRDWWDLLEVPENIFSDYQLRQAYLSKVKEFHPDTNPDKVLATRMTQLINDAYEEAKEIVANRQSDVNIKIKKAVVILPLNGFDEKETVDCKSGKVLGVFKIPTQYKAIRERCGEYAILFPPKLNKESGRAYSHHEYFSNETNAIKCMIELERDFMNIWDLDSNRENAEIISQMRKMIKFYAR